MPMHRHRFTDFTDALVPVYDGVFRVLAGRDHEHFRERVVELAAPQAGERLLDAGCGTGLTALRMAARFPGCAVHGIDISPRMIAAARRNADRQVLTVDLRIGDITALPFSDASFDAVITNLMFHHLDLEEKRRAVLEIARILRPGGRYISAEFGPRAENPLQRRLAKGEYTLYPEHLAEAGFGISHDEVIPFPFGRKIGFRVAVKRISPSQSQSLRHKE
jgi:ubiquinone/menaquinone biosynthesis C-methylase UbiE